MSDDHTENLPNQTNILESSITEKTLQEVDNLSNEVVQTNDIPPKESGKESSGIDSDTSVSDNIQEEIQVSENFKTLRQTKRKLEQENQQHLARIKELESKSTPVDSYSDDIDEEQTEVDKLRRELRSYQVNSAAIATEAKLKSQYPDFDKVVNKDNLDILSAKYPEIAQTIQTSKNLYSKAVSAYTLIKKFGVHLDDESIAQKQKATDNINKPRPVGSLQSDSPLKHAKDYSDLNSKDVRNDIIKKAMDLARNA